MNEPAKQQQQRRVSFRSDSSCTSPQLESRMSKGLDCLPTSPDGVITYLGRSYEVKDLFPSLVAARTEDLPEDSSRKSDTCSTLTCSTLSDSSVKSTTKMSPGPGPIRIRRPVNPVNRADDTGRSSLSPICRPLGRAKSSSTMRAGRPGAGRSISGSGLAAMRKVVVENEAMPPPPPGLLRSASLSATNSVRNLFASDFEEEEKDFGIHNNSMRCFHYTKDDVAEICDDKEEFERLKQTLKKKGAITNEVLNQRIHFYIKAKKDRDAGLAVPNKRRLRRSRSSLDGAADKKPSSSSKGLGLQRRGTTSSIQYTPK